MNSPVKLWSGRLTGALGLGSFILLLVVPIPDAYSQVSMRVVSVSPAEAPPNTPITIRVDLRQGAQLDKVYFVYRQFGESNYKRLEMDIVGTAATVSMPAKEAVPPFIEYYLVLVSQTGQTETYPVSESTNPFFTPPVNTLQIAVRAQESTSSPVIFLSPETTEPLAPEDVLISVSLLRVGSEIAKPLTQLLLDDVNITGDAVFSNDIIVYSPENFVLRLRPGIHNITVRLFDRSGRLQQTASSTFTVTGRAEFIAPSVATKYSYGVSVQLESRHELVSDVGTWYNRANLQLTGRADIWRLRSNFFITSDEKADRQPQNRYFVGAESPWLKIGYGDGYPSFPNLILSGKRLRGLHSALTLGAFNLDLAFGSTARAVDGVLLKTISADTLAYEQERDPTGAYARIDSVTWGKFSYGTYARDLFAIRPSFGSGETWQLGFTWLTSKDDIRSIQYGIRPQENIVVGTDLLTRIDEGRIELSGQMAFSAFNSDISSGNFTDAYIDSVYKKDAQAIKDARDILQHLITVNDYLRPLSFKKLSTLAYDVSTSFDYFNNHLKFTYLFRGSDYNSFGQTFLRKDIKGFNLSDRIRLFENQVLFVAGYERLQDNTSDTKAATATFSNLNFALSYYPRQRAPNFTLGFSRYVNTNDLNTSGPDQLSAIDDATNRFLVQTSYDFEFGAKHITTLSFSTSHRGDYTIHQYNVNNTTVMLGVTTRYTIPLQTAAEVVLNKNELPAGSLTGGTRKLDYTTISFSGRYSVLNETLSFLTAVTPTFGDFKRTVVDLGSEWYAQSAMKVSLQFSYLQNQGVTNDSIWSLRYRYDL